MGDANFVSRCYISGSRELTCVRITSFLARVNDSRSLPKPQERTHEQPHHDTHPPRTATTGYARFPWRQSPLKCHPTPSPHADPEGGTLLRNAIVFFFAATEVASENRPYYEHPRNGDLMMMMMMN